MKSIILSITTLFLAAAAFAQSTPADYLHEVGLYGGLGAFSNPQGTAYVGTRNYVPYAAAANYYYNFSEHFQAGIDMTMSRWETQGISYYGALNNGTGFSHTTNFLLADRVWSLTARANYVVPMYDNYRVNRANFYVGAAVGAVFTVNDGRTSYAQFNNKPGSENQYIDQYHYQSGTGYTMGIQVGYTYYISNHVGLNVEASPRYVHVSNNNHNLGSVNGGYSLFYFPTTLGVKYRF